MDFNEIIKNNFLYKYENNELKNKKYIITPFLNICEKELNNLSFRPHLVADVISKFYRQLNYNVMYNLNCNNLNDRYVVNSKIDYNELNDNILYNHLNVINKLNINYDYNRSIHLLDKDVIKTYQNLFLFLNDHNLIKYEENIVYYDPSYSYCYDAFSTDNFNHPKKEYGLFLDISNHMNSIINNINSLLINDAIKNRFKDVLGESINYTLNLKTQNDLDIQIKIDSPYLVGNLSCVLIGLSNLDILEYINPSEISYLEGYFKTKSSIYFDTKNYITNPLTGNKIPLFISKNIKKPIGLFSKDKELLEILNVKEMKIISDDNTLINSDYLDGMTIDSANEVILEDFTSEGIIEVYKEYLNNKILLSSNNNYGVIAPIMVEDNKMFVLSHKLPIYYDNKFNINVNNKNFNIYNKPLNKSFIALFNYIINIIFDRDRDFNKEFKDDLLYNLKRLLNNSLVIYNTNNEVEEILLPIIMLTIVENICNIILVDRIEFLSVGSSFDNYGYNIKEESNNLINYDFLFKQYNSDSIRMYLLNTNPNNKLYFYKDDIFKFKQLLYELDMIYNNLGDYNPIIDVTSIRFKETLYDSLLSNNISSIINNISEYIKYLRVNKPSKEQVKDLIIILSLIIPDISNKINSITYKNKLDLLSFNWSKNI